MRQNYALSIKNQIMCKRGNYVFFTHLHNPGGTTIYRYIYILINLTYSQYSLHVERVVVDKYFNISVSDHTYAVSVNLIIILYA